METTQIKNRNTTDISIEIQDKLERLTELNKIIGHLRNQLTDAQNEKANLVTRIDKCKLELHEYIEKQMK